MCGQKRESLQTECLDQVSEACKLTSGIAIDHRCVHCCTSVAYAITDLNISRTTVSTFSWCLQTNTIMLGYKFKISY